MAKKIWRFVGINFDHMHMGDLLRQVAEHPSAEIAGIWDPQPARMEGTIRTLGIPRSRVFADLDECFSRARPDVAILCPATGKHAEYVERVAKHRTHVFVEKPFAGDLAGADRMIRAVKKTGKRLVINWPLAWYPPHRTAKRLIDQGKIGQLIEVHYYDGNRGPLRHIADKVEISAAEAARQKSKSWWYQPKQAGGSLNDYLGYGTTLATWFLDGAKPLEVTGTVDRTKGLRVDEHAVAVARYAFGLSKFETRWGTFTDPWVLQPQPKCGFVLVGTSGTIASYDYEKTIRVQTKRHPEGEVIPVDRLSGPAASPIAHVIDAFGNGKPVIGPLDPKIARIGQQIVDTAAKSARLKRTLSLIR